MHPETATKKRNAIDDFGILIRCLIYGLRFQKRKLRLWSNSIFLKDRFWPKAEVPERISASASCVKHYCFVSNFIVLCPTLLFVHSSRQVSVAKTRP